MVLNPILAANCSKPSTYIEKKVQIWGLCRPFWKQAEKGLWRGQINCHPLFPVYLAPKEANKISQNRHPNSHATPGRSNLINLMLEYSQQWPWHDLYKWPWIVDILLNDLK